MRIIDTVTHLRLVLQIVVIIKNVFFQASEKNPGILRFGSLSVKVKKTTNAFNNYFGSNEKKHSLDSNVNSNLGGGDRRPSLPMISDAQRMPPPKLAPSKKRKNSMMAKRHSVDYGSLGMTGTKTKSAPSTPTEPNPVKELLRRPSSSAAKGSDDSDSEYGFDSQWGGGPTKT